MIDRVVDALAASRIETTHAVVSPLAPATCEHVGLPTIETPGDGYVSDLLVAADSIDRPVLTVAADLPLLTGAVVDAFLDVHAAGPGGSLAACVPVSLKRRLGASVGETKSVDGREVAPTGLNVVGGAAGRRDGVHLSDDARLAVNVNRRSDADLAEALL